MKEETYIARSVRKNAVVFDGDNFSELNAFVKDGSLTWTIKNAAAPRLELEINTLEGKMIVNIGDYIIRGVEGEYYPCKPAIFHRTYRKETE